MKKLFFTVLALAGLLCAAAQTQDWANFGRFEQANGQVRNPKVVLMGRSEERRVGKECRSRWSPYH